MRPLAASSVDVLRVMIAFLNSQLREVLRRVGVHAPEGAGVPRLVLADPVPGVADLDEARAVRLDPLAGGVVPEAAVLDRDDHVGRRAARSGRPPPAVPPAPSRRCLRDRRCRPTARGSARAARDRRCRRHPRFRRPRRHCPRCSPPCPWLPSRPPSRPRWCPPRRTVPVVPPAPVVPAPPPDSAGRPPDSGSRRSARRPRASATQSAAAVGAANDARGRAAGMHRIPAPAAG